jgi:hypothetical protein
MSIYTPKGVAEEPDAVLDRYAVYETEDGEHHFVGYNRITCDGRVSSKIEQWNPDTRTGITRSGRRYKLQEYAGFVHDDAVYVWGIWCQRNGIKTWKDVTNKYVIVS